MSSERVEFEQVIDGLLIGAMEALKDPPLLEKLRAAGLDLTRRLQPAYPAAQFFGWMSIAARHRYPEQSEEEALREIGRLAVRRGLEATLLGRAVLTGAKLLGVRRALKRIGSMFKNGNNYIDGKTTELGPNSLEIQLGPIVGPSGYYEGVLEEAPRILGGTDIQVTRLRNEGEHIVWRVDWKD